MWRGCSAWPLACSHLPLSVYGRIVSSPLTRQPDQTSLSLLLCVGSLPGVSHILSGDYRRLDWEMGLTDFTQSLCYFQFEAFCNKWKYLFPWRLLWRAGSSFEHEDEWLTQVAPFHANKQICCSHLIAHRNNGICSKSWRALICFNIWKKSDPLCLCLMSEGRLVSYNGVGTHGYPTGTHV